MPASFIKHLTSKYGISKSKAEEYWERAKEQCEPNDYRCIAGVAKKIAAAASKGKSRGKDRGRAKSEWRVERLTDLLLESAGDPRKLTRKSIELLLWADWL